MSGKMKRMLALLIALMLFMGIFPAVSENAQEETRYITGKYPALGKKGTLREWQFPYSDDLFLGDDGEYNHTLAQASLGLALSAFRDTNKALGHQQDNILSYLTDAEFEGIRIYGYDEKPGSDTISCAIAHKKIGTVTLLAVAVCGGGYGNEWKSNFLVGDETRHVGFNQAAQTVQGRVKAYLDENGLSGDVRLWISGYSRAAATSNITAADLTDSGLFTQVYAYTFATPNTTRDTGNYTNIFNIIGKTDPVPAVPLRDWGYAHYGIDLYTPAQEFDADYVEKAMAATDVSYELTGDWFQNNPVINYALHNILGYLLAAYPTPSVYQPALGQTLIDLWGASSVQMVDVLLQALASTSSMPEEQKTEFSALASYVDKAVAYQLRNREKLVENGLWNENAGLSDNVAHEHNPDVYVDWMFSTDNGEDLFSDESDSYLRLILYGDVTVDVYDAYGFVQRMQSDGTLITDPEAVGEPARTKDSETYSPELFFLYEEGKLVIDFPQDCEWAMVIRSDTAQEVEYIATRFTVTSLTGEIGGVHTLSMEAGGTHYVLLNKDFLEMQEASGEVIQQLQTLGKYSPSLIVGLEELNVLHLSLSEMLVLLLAVLIVLAVFALIELILLIVRLIRRKKRRVWVSLITYGLIILSFYGLAAFARDYLNAVTIVYIIFKSIATFFSAMLALSGAKCGNKRLGWFVFGGVLLALCGDISGDSLLSMAFFVLFMGLVSAGLILEKRLKKRDLLLGLCVWIGLCLLLLRHRELLGVRYWYFIAYLGVLCLFVTLSLRADTVLRAGCMGFALCSFLLGANMVFSYSSAFRTWAVGGYVLSLYIISASSFFLRGLHPVKRKIKAKRKEASEA